MKQAPTVSRLVVAGEEVVDGKLVEVRSPWDGRVVSLVPFVPPEAALASIEAASRAMETGLPAHERAAILDRTAAEVRARREEFAGMISDENGKPIKQALAEADRCVQILVFSAVEARSLAGRGIPLSAHPAGEAHLGFTIRVPVGVVAAITPFNFPLTLAAHKIAPAVAAGCGVVLKPADKAPTAAIELVHAFHRAGLPREWMSVIVGPPAEIAEVFAEDERVGLLTFTGSAAIGWDLRRRAPRKRVTLELGNSTPVIVCADADLETAAAMSAASGYAFAGQSCISVQRVIVHASVRARFADLLTAAAEAQSAGDPADPRTDVGPLITREARDRVTNLVEGALSTGATARAGGTFGEGHLKPLVLEDVAPDQPVWAKEAFGPVISVTAFETLDEAIDLANATEYGLQAGIFTRDLGSALDAIHRMRFGGVTVNQAPQFRVDQMPYGGTKASGNTKEGPHDAVREMTEERMVVVRL
ncbi:MAG: aldehyde dehydrogenase family protein [Actinobacteria bacterium]|nr:aldehyde dehydrogenase family protein [Actinomycetota bacterium]